uniref:(northern house mosquito) hypothetical protein n=1 Tax=Culex pipiens TaxID=7175 RepID=A0A8D8C6F8_CULPI
MVGIGSRTCRGGRSWGLSSCANPLPLGGVQMVVRRKLQLRLLVVSMTAAPRVQSVSAIGPSANRSFHFAHSHASDAISFCKSSSAVGSSNSPKHLRRGDARAARRDEDRVQSVQNVSQPAVGRHPRPTGQF